MNASWVAARAGVRRGWIELKHTFTTPGDLVTLLIFTGILLGVMLWTRTTTVPGTHFSLGTAMLASMLGMTVGFNGLATLGSILTVEREDGTLLRAKATPNGMTGYLIGKVVTVSGTILISVAATLITGALLFSGLAVGSASTWLTLIPVVLLGLLATLPIGAVLGSLFNGSGRCSRCTGWDSARVRPCCPRTWPRWRSVIPGGTWPPSAC
jgi:ABC-2 type transport system permease protein